MEEKDAMDPRGLALLAAERGWIDAGALWDAAVRYARAGERPSAVELLPQIGPEMLATLRTERDDAFVQTTSLAERPPAGDLRSEVHLRPEPRASPVSLRGAIAARYVLGDELGRGGGGQVVAARDEDLGRTVAMKTMNAGAEASGEQLHRFLEEARVTGQLEHPSVIPCTTSACCPMVSRSTRCASSSAPRCARS